MHAVQRRVEFSATPARAGFRQWHRAGLQHGPPSQNRVGAVVLARARRDVTARATQWQCVGHQKPCEVNVEIAMGTEVQRLEQ